MKWQAPADFVGTVKFHATIVKSFAIFWGGKALETVTVKAA